MADKRPAWSRQDTDHVDKTRNIDKIPDDEGVTTATLELDSERAHRFRNALLSGAADSASERSDSASVNNDGNRQDKLQTGRWELYSFYLYCALLDAMRSTQLTL